MLRFSLSHSAAVVVAMLCSMLVVPSCVGTLELDGYADASAELCELLEQCYGDESFRLCGDRFATNLAAATPEQRSAWLAKVDSEGCLGKCSAAVTCADDDPICGAAGTTCSSAAECCGFLESQSRCEGGRCCLDTGAACDVNDDRCCGSTCNPITNTCGGDSCKDFGDSCQEDKDCCSENCNAEGKCQNVCQPLGIDCETAADCCSGRCQGGFCACLDGGQQCASDAACCSGYCDPTSNTCTDLCGGVGSTCDPVASPCCDGFDCGEDGACCKENTTSCDTSDECCTGHCNLDGDGACCSDIGQYCGDSNECCVGHCQNTKCSCVPPDSGIGCDDFGDCCSDTGAPAGCTEQGSCQLCYPAETCVDLCVPSASPLGNDAGWAQLCADANNVADPILIGACVSTLCEEHPECCCFGFTDACSQKVLGLPECAGLCPNPN